VSRFRPSNSYLKPELGRLRTTNGKSDRPVDIALERGFISLSKILEPPPDLLPNISPYALERIQEHFEAVVKYEARGIFKPECMRVADIELLREYERIWMPIPGMYGVRERVSMTRRYF
jgi:hypothetical protein